MIVDLSWETAEGRLVAGAIMDSEPKGATLDEIAETTGLDRWSAHAAVCGLRAKYYSEKVRGPHNKLETRYHLGKRPT